MLIRPRRGSPTKPTHVGSYVAQDTAKPPLVAGEGWLGTLASCRGELTAVWIPDEALEVLRDFSV